MKTSIFVSSFAALYLLLTFAETPNHNNAWNSSSSMSGNYSYIPSTFVNTLPGVTITAKSNAKADFAVADALNENFNYLKFNVADYAENTGHAGEALPESSSDYLKFNVNEYNEASVITSPDAIELPVNEFARLKFDVSGYTENTVITSPDAIELPFAEFAILKFNAIKYAENDIMISGEITELPVDENSYLEFDINKYADQSTLSSGNFGELPVN